MQMTKSLRLLTCGLFIIGFALERPNAAFSQEKAPPPADDEVVLPLPRAALPPIIALPPYFSTMKLLELVFGLVLEPKAPTAPDWYPLSADHDKYLNQVLMFWEKSSARIERYRCNFTRFTYDPAFTQREPKTGELPAKTVAYGEINFLTPDKYLFREDKIEHFVPPRTTSGKGKYEVIGGEKGDHWISDGESIFLFNYPNKKVLQTELPAFLQGPGIFYGSLPYMLRIIAANMKERFWIRVITPADVTGEYWLEAYPKRREDAANFKMIRVIFDIQSNGNDKYALPKALAIYDRSPSSQSFLFTDREVNWDTSDTKLKPFDNEFYKVAIPPGFDKSHN
jgi:TIGR03009 family protein